ncbi:uncharacterized protein B0I36DRAFT_129322 [Microdochium trichocladiopsis]|uniref:2EXR domain-containing protein n=1 Tax=Microdochium trichocladiopsis TaxID=1682393 RepID=A0A9P9BPF2_9PEZI|nr:uncharacterized protein B0I36DRAFT_129322 [Microdochium trichocladiopsis]KAH7029199.1 hypothetical protein B0I36DRAFT_129322 [Microdochium trichocladiopsis]
MEEDESSSESAASPGFYQEGPATSDRGEGSEGEDVHDSDVQEREEDDDEDEESEDEGSEGSDSEEDQPGGGLIDLEASESGSSEDESDDDEENEYGESYNEYSSRTFEPFMRLPAELRERVWELYNPYLKERKGRVLTCVLSDGWQPRIIETQVLSTIMSRTNTMLGVHHETRTLALQHFPHTLKSGTEFGLIRFHRDRDILFFSFPGEPVPLHRFDVTKLYDSIGEFRHLAIDCAAITPLAEWLASPQVRALTSRLDTLYLNYEAVEVRSRDLRWCFSLPTRTFCVDTEEESVGIGEDSEYTYCWVDRTDPAFDRDKMVAECGELYDCFGLEDEAGTTLLPMAEFAFLNGTMRYEKLAQRYRDGWETGVEFSSDEEESESEPDEYESEGIDDDTIDEDSPGSDDDDDLVVRDDADSDDEDGSRPPSISGSGPSPIEIEDDVMEAAGDDGDDGAVVARFSSIEAESPGEEGGGSASDDDDDAEVPVQRAKRAKRPRVVDSDSEDGSEPAEQRPRKMARRVPIIVSDDDSEDDDKNSDDSDVQEVPAPSRKRMRRVAQESSEVEEEDSASSEEDGSESGSEEQSEDEDDGEDDEEKPRRPQTLAERLRLFRDDNPVPEGEEQFGSGSEDDESRGGHYNDGESERGSDDMDDARANLDGETGMDTFEAEWDDDDEAGY